MPIPPSKTASQAASVRDTVHAVIGMLSTPQLLVWALYLLLQPIYLWQSGLPQIGDMLVLALAPMALAAWNGRLSREPGAALRVLIGFIVYVVVENLVWTFALMKFSMSGKDGFGIISLFYVYNALVFVVVLVMYRRHGPRLLWLTGKILLGGLLLQAFVALAAGGGAREKLLFNNPNQLGYFALLSVSMLLLLQRARYVSTIEVAIGGVAASYLALLSASKAALGGIAILVIVGVFVRLRTILVVGLLFGFALLVATPLQDAIDRTMTRFATDKSAGFVEERGYDRILNHPEYWVLGAGEGAYRRFADTTAIGSHEIHSSIGTLFFCYGAVGTLIFAYFVWLVMRRTGLRTWLLVAPSFAYGMTHQGLRFTVFWVLLALVVALKEVPSAPRSRS